MVNRFLIFSFLIILGCKSKQNSKEDPRGSLQLAPLTSEAFKKLFLSPFAWKDVETKISAEEKKKWFKENIRWVMPEYIDSSYLAGVHVMDFNGDGINDYIYSGRGPVIFQCSVDITNTPYSFGNRSMITDMDIVDNKVRRLYLFDILGTGGPSVEGYSIVDVVYDNDKINFVRRIACEQINEIALPVIYSNFEVESILDSLAARDFPIELDTPRNYVLELPGNQLGKILKGTRAIVAGQKKDSLNNEWYFTLVKPGFKIHGYPYMNMTFDPKDSLYRMVWSKGDGWKKVN